MGDALLLEEVLQIPLLFLSLFCQEIFLQQLVMVGEGISIHSTHVANTVHHLLLEVAYL